MKTLLFVITFLSCSACSVIRYKTENRIPVSLAGGLGEVQEVDIIGEAEFYLWGLYPSEQVVLIDKEAKDRGFQSISKLKLEEYTTWWGAARALFTLGMYTPRTYRIRGYGIR